MLFDIDANISDETATDGRLYVTVAQDPDGQVSGVRVGTISPGAWKLWRDEPRATVWAGLFPERTMPLPGMKDDTADATKVLDLAHSGLYLDEDPEQWVAGERIAQQHQSSGERRFLRLVEARLIRAGIIDAYAGTVSMCQTYGITFAGTGAEHYLHEGTSGWRLAYQDCHAYDGLSMTPGPIAPAGASALRTVGAVLGWMLAYDAIDPAELTPLYRLLALYNLWRITPNWTNFKSRTRQRLHAWNYRITKRVIGRRSR